MCNICHKYKCPAGCPNAPEPQIKGCCYQCGEELRQDYDYYTDIHDNEFCSEECAIEYHKITRKEWD